MEKCIEELWARIDKKFDEQTANITNAVTSNVMVAIDDRLKSLTDENTQLKTKICTLEEKLSFIEREKRKNNLVVFGIEEIGKTEAELVDYVKETIVESGTYLDSQEINNIYRIGKKVSDKNRPVVISIASTWKKHLILKNRAKLPEGIYIKEDFPKEVLEKRKQLQNQVEEEKKKGNVAFIKYDKLIVKKPTNNIRDKRKREDTGERNDNGKRLINLAFTYNLKIMNSFYKKKHSKKWTWVSPNGQTKNEIDYILTNKPSIFKDLDTVNQLNFNTNHRMMIKNKNEDTIQNKYNTLERELKAISCKINNSKIYKDKIGDEARALMETRKRLIVNRTVNRKEIAELNKEINNKIRKHTARSRLQTIQHHIERTGGTKKALKELRDKTEWIPNLHNKVTATKVSTRPLIIDTATEFYRELYSDTENTNSPLEYKEDEEEVPTILESETGS
ncbi:uncharacterized protein LOC134745845 [Cydia strobilella]|uniref:uncharacterized protein LOC134745845 n=1 Tax=Cydia strobilella TaxID=1100964 RepID=UPI0030051F5E